MGFQPNVNNPNRGKMWRGRFFQSLGATTAKDLSLRPQCPLCQMGIKEVAGVFWGKIMQGFKNKM